jgi:hypothetical protein
VRDEERIGEGGEERFGEGGFGRGRWEGEGSGAGKEDTIAGEEGKNEEGGGEREDGRFGEREGWIVFVVERRRDSLSSTLSLEKSFSFSVTSFSLLFLSTWMNKLTQDERPLSHAR